MAKKFKFLYTTKDVFIQVLKTSLYTTGSWQDSTKYFGRKGTLKGGAPFPDPAPGEGEGDGGSFWLDLGGIPGTWYQ